MCAGRGDRLHRRSGTDARTEGNWAGLLVEGGAAAQVAKLVDAVLRTVVVTQAIHPSLLHGGAR